MRAPGGGGRAGAWALLGLLAPLAAGAAVRGAEAAAARPALSALALCGAALVQPSGAGAGVLPDPPTPTLLLFNWCSMNGTQKRRTKDNRHAHNVVWVPPFTLPFCNYSCGARCALVAAAVEAALGGGRVH